MIFNTGAAAGSSAANEIEYDNANSGLESTDIQGAIDEMTSNTEIINTNITTMQTNEKAQILTFASKSIATSAWASSTTYADYPYRATVSCSGVTTNHIPHVAFRVAQVDSGNFASVAESTSNGVYVYAKEKPTETIYVTIQAIKSIT